MPRYQYERLSAADNVFLLWETPTLHMHVSSVAVLERGPLASASGGIDIRRIRDAIEAALPRIPRYRQRLEWIPGFRHAVWVDDAHFDLGYHVRHTALPRPGSDAQLKKLASRVMAQQLDRSRPLWEIWVVEGLAGDRFAIVSKLHHCMVDGISGVDLTTALFSKQRETPRETPQPHLPRSLPSRRELWRDEMSRLLGAPLRAARSLRARDDLRDELRLRLRALRNLAAIRFASATPINGTLGPHRSFDWYALPLARAKQLKTALGCSVNDVVLAICTGAFREYLRARGVNPGSLVFQVQAPVSVRAEGDTRLGNQVSNWTLQLPVGEPDPLRQLEAIYETTRHLKETRQALGIATISEIAEWTTGSLLSLGARAATNITNSLITNVPGPQYPLFLVGAQVQALYPQPPLLPNVGLSIGLVSYDGTLFWGLCADPERVPDLDAFVEKLERAYQELERAAAHEPPLRAPARAAGARRPRGRRASA